LPKELVDGFGRQGISVFVWMGVEAVYDESSRRQIAVNREQVQAWDVLFAPKLVLLVLDCLIGVIMAQGVEKGENHNEQVAVV
jgi:hypothetical protein